MSYLIVKFLVNDVILVIKCYYSKGIIQLFSIGSGKIIEKEAVQYAKSMSSLIKQYSFKELIVSIK